MYHVYGSDYQRQQSLSVLNDLKLKGIYFGDCIIKRGLGILGEQKFDN